VQETPIKPGAERKLARLFHSGPVFRHAFARSLARRIPRLVAADAAFYSAKNEAAAKAKGVKRVCIPNRSTKSPERRREQKKRWFRQGQKWRTGCEGRISVVKRRHGLNRCRYKGDAGMKRWVGLGVIADNLINIGRAMAKQSVP
jgi:IS5 family transposase